MTKPTWKEMYDILCKVCEDELDVLTNSELSSVQNAYENETPLNEGEAGAGDAFDLSIASFIVSVLSLITPFIIEKIKLGKYPTRVQLIAELIEEGYTIVRNPNVSEIIDKRYDTLIEVLKDKK